MEAEEQQMPVSEDVYGPTESSGTAGVAEAGSESANGVGTTTGNFLERFLGLDTLGSKTRDVIEKVRAPVDRGIDGVIGGIRGAGRSIADLF